ncbi:MAG: hypothetical protein U5R49_24170 [Deltaproteobacteria bacterium]|nr:hypothetical protein [Deltaproteobacteria bacterium]
MVVRAPREYAGEIEQIVRERGTSSYYLSGGNYIDLLDPDEYYTVSQVRRVRRQRINDNLLGDHRFCPTVRRTDTLREFETADLPGRCRQVVAGYSPEILKRALKYLYTKETRSSFEIEHVHPTSNRTERFVALLQLAEQEDFCRKPQLIEVQNLIVDARFRDADYRKSQNYVGETVAWQRERIHFVCPKPEGLADLMDGLTAAHERMNTGRLLARKRASHFDFLSSEEIATLEQTVRSAYGSETPENE